MFSKILSSMTAISALASLALCAVTPEMSLDERSVAKRSLSGQATYYGGNVAGGACSFSTYTLPSGLYGTALSDSNWANSANCGGCVSVSYGGKSITAMVRFHARTCAASNTDWMGTDCRRMPRMRYEPPRSFPRRFCRSRNPVHRRYQHHLGLCSLPQSQR